MTYVAPLDWAPKGVDYLEPNAWRALRTVDESVCVVASAGAGKTEFLAQKAAFLLETGLCRGPQRILAISFKRDAAWNLGRRVRERTDASLSRRLDSLTFDAFTKGLVDRFGPALPAPYRPSPNYRIVFPRRDDLNDFLRRNGAQHIDPNSLSKRLASTRLPIRTAELDDLWKRLLKAYWVEAYRDAEETLLDFLMLNRLAEYIVRIDAQIERAIRWTYPHVFLDEFQDTTAAQYELILTIFHGTKAALTAVGDDKQRIMVWAGAMEDGFERFQLDFCAEEMALFCNWRSHEDLVRIQHVIASRIDENSVAPEARAARKIEGEVAAIWSYNRKQDECAGLARWIADEVQCGRVAADDVAILVRSYANDYEAELSPHFLAQGLRLRNVARQVGEIAIQDLLAEELTAAALALLRLAAEDRAPMAWQEAVALQHQLRGVTEGDELAETEIRSSLEGVIGNLRDQMRKSAPEDADLPYLLRTALNFIDETALRRAVPEYRRTVDYERVLLGVSELLQESVREAANWSEALNRFEGVGQVALMTVHKSKGLEFHTMIFLGLDTGSWWSLTPTRSEELKSLFVAFTRAMQRAFFSSCAQRGGSIAWIERLLAPAGVGRVEGPAADIAQI